MVKSIHIKHQRFGRIPMQAQLTYSLRPVHARSALTTLTIAALVGTSAIFGAMQAFVMGADPMLVGVSVVLLVVAGVVATGWRWAPALGGTLLALLTFGLLAPAIDQLWYEITH